MPEPTPRHQWVEDIRGPILFLPTNAIAAWPGVEPGEGWPGNIVVPGVLGIAPAGESIGLMLHDDYTGAYTTWEPLPEGGVLVGDIAYQGDASVDAVAAVPEAAWIPIAPLFPVGAGGAVLFDGAWKGEEFAETGFAVDIAPGTYRVDAVPRFEHGAVVARYVRLTRTGVREPSTAP
jgi:hypothetical protein